MPVLAAITPRELPWALRRRAYSIFSAAWARGRPETVLRWHRHLLGRRHAARSRAGRAPYAYTSPAAGH
jgi:hypothetical protein